MNTKATTVTVKYQNINGYHYFNSDEVTGLHVGSSDLNRAFHDVAPVIEMLMEANHGVQCRAEPLMTFEEFLVAAAKDGVQTKEDADERTYALQIAA